MAGLPPVGLDQATSAPDIEISLMRRSRHLLAVTLVAAALCADRAVAALPSRPQGGQIAARLIQRLSDGFRRAVTTPRIQQVRIGARVQASAIQGRQGDENAPARIAMSPFQFRLPPPAI